jgi:hypothetical protein
MCIVARIPGEIKISYEPCVAYAAPLVRPADGTPRDDKGHRIGCPCILWA